MKGLVLRSSCDSGIDDIELYKGLEQSVGRMAGKLKKILLLPPDITRYHSGAGKITSMFYNMLKDTCTIDINACMRTTC